jgi:hypothetical protein
MTKTDIQLDQLKRDIQHLSAVTEEGWELAWGDSDETVFNLVCKGANALQVMDIDRLVTDAHTKAKAVLLQGSAS